MDRAAWSAFVELLDQTGYFKYADPSAISGIKQCIIETRSLFNVESCGEQVGRIFAGDAERLAEGGVLGFLFEISPFLQNQGVSGFPYLDQDFRLGRFKYTIKVNLDEHVMLAEKERGDVIAWVAVPARAFLFINKLLERVGSRERVYTNEGSIARNSFAIFLTPELYALIANCPFLPDDDHLLTVDELLKLI